MKFVAAISAILVASSSAFAPATTSGRVSTRVFSEEEAAAPVAAAPTTSAFAKELGAQPPLGFIDPLGLVADGDKEYFDMLRGAELKHGRVAMLGIVGYLVTLAGVRFPGAEDIPSGIAALSAVPGMVWAQFWATTALMEAVNRDVTGKGEFVGDFRNGFIDFGWDKLNEETKMKKRAIELNNGRAAQMGLTGIVIHEMMGNLGEILPGQ